MEMFHIGICALCAVILGALIKKSNKEYALVMSLAACALILLFVMERAGPLVEQVSSLAQAAAFQQEYLIVLIKAAGIALIGQVVAGFCKDAGESGLASAVELAARTGILLTALPVITGILNYLEELAKL